jgi:membrane-associated protease RseP (regulator of RpoE activity)
MVGVLSDDLVASHADLWVWLPAPGPILPARVRVRIDDGSAAATIRDAFAADLMLRRQWLGAILIDSDAAAGPVVTRIAEEGPAARAGLLVGDVISAIGAQRVETAAAAEERLSALDPEATVTLAVIRSGRAESVEVLLGSSPSVSVPAGSTPLYPAVLTLLTRRLEAGDTSVPAWVIQLNQAAVLMQAGAWEQAVDTLRQIPDAPTGPGLGRAAVDYWFGIAASALGPGYYDIARTAFSGAASVPGATLFHNDGPLVAPRAQARLQSLGGSSPPR